MGRSVKTTVVQGLHLDSLDLEFLSWHGLSVLQGAKWEAYKAVWIEAMEREPCEWKRQNAGRRAANTRLREYERKVSEKGV